MSHMLLFVVAVRLADGAGFSKFVEGGRAPVGGMERGLNLGSMERDWRRKGTRIGTESL